MAIPFTEKDDPRGAYIAGSSGSPTYTSSGPITPAETQAFTAGVQSTQQNVPQIFQDTVEAAGPPTDDGQLTLQVTKNPLKEQLENLENQDQAFEFLNTLNQINTGGTSGMGILQPEVLGFIKEPLAAIGAFTTDPTENRNVYQLLINRMFQGDNERMRGALPLNQSAVQGMRRLGPTLFRDPNVDVSFGQNLMSLLPGVVNPGVVNIMDMPGGGIAELPEFGQAGLDFTKEQGFKDYGKLIEGLFTAATPFKYGKMLGDKTMNTLGDFYNNLYPNRRTEEEELDTLIDSIDDE